MNEKIAVTAENAVGKNRDQVGCKGTYAWCAAFVSRVLMESGIDNIGFDTSCNSIFNKMKLNNDWSEPDEYPVRGDVIFFDWDRIDEPKPIDHIGIVTDFDYINKTVTYVNGNGNSDSIVTRQSINIHNQSVAYWLHYIGANNDYVSELEKQVIELKTKIEKIKNVLDI